MTVSIEYDDLCVQNGSTFAGIWSDAAGFAYIQPLQGDMGLVYDFTSVITSDFLRPTQLTLSCLVSQPTGTGITVSLYVVDELDPDDFSDTALPGGRSDSLAENLICTVTGSVGAAGEPWTNNASVEYLFGQSYSSGAWTEDPTMTRNWQRFWARRVANEGWSGRVAFSHMVTAGTAANGPYFDSLEPGPTGVAPIIVATSWGYSTGHVGYGLDNGRSVHDMKSGLPCTAGDLVEDAFHPGVWTESDHWDDKDRRGEVTLPEGEGRVRDKIPQ